MHIFISYAKKDSQNLAFRLYDELNAIQGITAWADKSLIPSEEWDQDIQSNIDNCDLMIVLLSPDVNRPKTDRQDSSFVLKEISRAKRKLKKILPIMVEPTDIPLEIERIEYIDFTSNQQVGLNRLFKYLYELLNRGPYEPLPIFSLPSPFDWCEIPSGFVTIKDENTNGGSKGGIFEIDRFSISKYPITNAQFQLFLGDYSNPNWWDYSNESLSWFRDNPQPVETSFEGSDLPRTNVSWYEAVAFCKWLSNKTGYTISLPSEQQWQRAAQGDSSWAYPWGDRFSTKFCNCNSEKTTSVIKYPEGASPYKVMDLSGNVWEWCASEWETGNLGLAHYQSKSHRVLRGGSWKNNDLTYFRCDFRRKHLPSGRGNTAGFRIVRRFG